MPVVSCMLMRYVCSSEIGICLDYISYMEHGCGWDEDIRGHIWHWVGHWYIEMWCICCVVAFVWLNFHLVYIFI